MKKNLAALWLATALVFAAPQAGALDTGNAIDFAITFNTMADNRSSFEDGYGIWVGFRRDALPFLSIGGEVGFSQFYLCRCDLGLGEDTITQVPVMITAHVTFTLEDVLTVFGEVGAGASFNFISGRSADKFNLSIDPSLAMDLRAGALLQVAGNFGIGGMVDAFISQATVNGGGGSVQGTLNLGHYGAGVIAIVTF